MYIHHFLKSLALATFDVAIFALKSYDTQTALDSIRPYSIKHATVLCLQNGVENEPALGDGSWEKQGDRWNGNQCGSRRATG